jgi:DNA-binding transcriptional regulator GbsR (MarR family)
VLQDVVELGEGRHGQVGGGPGAGNKSGVPGERPAAALTFVEEMALFLEREGLPRMAGRIFAWLLVCDPPHQSAADLATVLRASKGSISSMTGLLVRARLIERTALPGHRRDYFRVRPRAMSELMMEATARIAAFRRLSEQGLALLEDRPEAVRERLQDMRAVAAFLEAEYPALVARWEQRQGGQNGQDAPERRP